MPLFFNTANVSVVNKAVGGTSSKSFYNLFWPAVRDGLQAGDFVFIQFGINDRNNANPARYTPTGGEFESYLTKYINETKAKVAPLVLVSTLRRNAWNGDGVTVYDSYHDHPVAPLPSRLPLHHFVQLDLWYLQKVQVLHTNGLTEQHK